MYVYEMSFPIENFGAMRNFREWYKCKGADTQELRCILNRCLRRLAMMETYWEGDICEDELYIGSVPDDADGNLKYYIALKQDSNGSSYIVSEFPLKHLSDREKLRGRDKPVTHNIQIGIKFILNRFSPENEDI